MFTGRKQLTFDSSVVLHIFVIQIFNMKKIIAIFCFAAFTTAGFASSLATFTHNSTVINLGDKDKDKKKKKEKAACCSKGPSEKKACSDTEKSSTENVSGVAGTQAGTTAQPKSCCKKDGAAKSCSDSKEKK
jgi:hypothetical protein